MRISTRLAFVLLALTAISLLVSGLILGEVLRLQPCHLCNFQRFLYILIGLLAVCAALFPRWRLFWVTLLGVSAVSGIIAAIQQSWMQYAPQLATECGFGDPTPVEQLVDWLAVQWPAMFMVTGLCSSKDWVFLGLSLANWSGLCFAGLLCAIFWIGLRKKTRL